jgi:hypothetical protein
MTDKEVQFFKLLAVSAVLLYLYKASQAQGKTLAGNPFGVNVRGEQIVNLASQFVPKQYRHHAKKLGNVIVERYM